LAIFNPPRGPDERDLRFAPTSGGECTLTPYLRKRPDESSTPFFVCCQRGISYGPYKYYVSVGQRVFNDSQKPRISPWMDISNIEPGTNWDQEIRDKIDESSYFVALVSDITTSNEYVQTL
jgi:hypothetical protein